MANKTCQICYYYEDDWNNYGQIWCRYYKSYTDIDYAERCKNFRPESKSSGCYLTTACVEVKGLKDDCHELTMMRSLRDGYMKETGKENEIADYYTTAPKIIACIELQANKTEVYDNLYSHFILPCVEYMDHNEPENAYRKYVEMINNLKSTYQIN